jgi:hypothetical protein
VQIDDAMEIANQGNNKKQTKENFFFLLETGIKENKLQN